MHNSARETLIAVRQFVKIKKNEARNVTRGKWIKKFKREPEYKKSWISKKINRNILDLYCTATYLKQFGQI